MLILTTAIQVINLLEETELSLVAQIVKLNKLNDELKAKKTRMDMNAFITV